MAWWFSYMKLAEIQTALRCEDINVLLGHKSCFFYIRKQTFIQTFWDSNVPVSTHSTIALFEKEKSVFCSACGSHGLGTNAEVCAVSWWTVGMRVHRGLVKMLQEKSFWRHRNHSLFSCVVIIFLESQHRFHHSQSGPESDLGHGGRLDDWNDE